MERVGVIGTSWRVASVSDLGPLTIPPEDRDQRLPQLKAEIGASELVYLATCGRVDVIFVAAEGETVSSFRPRVVRALLGREPSAGEAERIFRAWGGEGAIEHLFLVASGLDSAKIGETEILGQVREAYETSRRLGLTGPRLDRILNEALRVASRVHTDTELGRGHTSLAEVAIERITQRLDRHPGSVALVGVSAMTRRAAEKLAHRGAPLVIVNRTLDRAQQLAEEVGGVALTLSEFRQSPPAVEAILSATSAPSPILTRTELEKVAARTPSGEPTLVIDMAVPPDVDPEGARAANVLCLNIDDIARFAEQSRRGRESQMAEARALVDRALVEFLDQIVDRMLGPMMATLQRRYRHTALTGIERLCRRELSGLGEEQLAAVRAWAETLAHRFAHVPAQGLRAIAREHGLAPVELFFEKGDDLLARELAQVIDESMRASESGGTQSGLRLRPEEMMMRQEDRP